MRDENEIWELLLPDPESGELLPVATGPEEAARYARRALDALDSMVAPSMADWVQARRRERSDSGGGRQELD